MLALGVLSRFPPRAHSTAFQLRLSIVRHPPFSLACLGAPHRLITSSRARSRVNPSFSRGALAIRHSYMASTSGFSRSPASPRAPSVALSSSSSSISSSSPSAAASASASASASSSPSASGSASRSSPTRGVALNGVAHTILVVADFPRSMQFYTALCQFMSMTEVLRVHNGDANDWLYFVGGRTALGIRPAASNDDRFSQERVGLHHICFRLRSREDVDKMFAHVRDAVSRFGGRVCHSPMQTDFAPGYYSFLVEDLSGIRLEWNFVPSRGVLGLEKPQVQVDDWEQKAAKL